MTPEQFAAHLDDPAWRLANLYKIIIKSDEDDPGLVIPFVPNVHQERLLARLWHRNLVLKARQLGITTLIALLWLDTALFSKGPVRCGIIAQDKDAAEYIFRDKVKFAYEHLPDELRERMPLARDSATELLFAHNNSSVRVATSLRSGTIHRLHVSEFGKICAKYPDKAREVTTGSIQAVPSSGIIVIESTAEGQDGAFYTMTEQARATAEQGKKLTRRDYRFHFYPWWESSDYEIDPEGMILSEADLLYFAKVEAEIGRALSPRQRAWYVATRDADFGNDPTLMWSEYPSTPQEAFQVSTEGCYYARQLTIARQQGRILPTLPLEAAPVNTFWDLGRGDMTAIWFHQRIGPENRFLRYYENSGEELSHYVEYLQRAGFIFGTHYLPHEAEYKRLGETPDKNRSLKEMLEALMPGQRFQIVPRVTAINAGIQATRAAFASCWFDETGCKQGLARLANYKKTWNATVGAWSSTPRHDDHSHGADAFRQFGQEADAGNRFPHGASSPKLKRRRTGMAA